MLSVNIIGAGFVGLSTMVTLDLAMKRRVDITLFDNNPDVVAQEYPATPCPDTGLQNHLDECYQNYPIELYDGTVTNEPDYTFIAIPTPLVGDGLNVTQLELLILDALEGKSTIVVRSTVPPHFLSKFKDEDRRRIILWPEFLTQAHFMRDTLNFKEAIIGGPLAPRLVKDLRLEEVFPVTRISLVTTVRAAQVKLLRNTYLAMRTGFFQEAASIMGGDAQRGIDLICRDERIGDHYNTLTFGCGGVCLPKDATSMANMVFEDFPIISGVGESFMDSDMRMAERIDKLSRGHSHVVLHSRESTIDEFSPMFRIAQLYREHYNGNTIHVVTSLVSWESLDKPLLITDYDHPEAINIWKEVE